MTAPSTAHDLPGWFGKLSILGDFAQRRLPDDFVRRCDTWLSQAMTGSREHLGESWLETYLHAPVLRFGWAPGVVDPNWWFGVLMSSCDQVGRYFPLLIAQRRARPPVDRIALDHLELWFDHLAQAALHTLNDGATMEALEDALLHTPPWPTPGMTAPMRAAPTGAHYALSRTANLCESLHAIAVRELLSRLADSSVWWCQTDTGQDSTLTVVHGLPDGSTFASLLSGA